MRTLGRARTYECQVFVSESSLTRVKSDPDGLTRAYAHVRETDRWWRAGAM